jgi:hypothetical protein
VSQRGGGYQRFEHTDGALAITTHTKTLAITTHTKKISDSDV